MWKFDTENETGVRIVNDLGHSFPLHAATLEEFRVALADHDRQTKAGAWDEGYMAVPAEPEDRETFVEDADNPYRRD